MNVDCNVYNDVIDFGSRRRDYYGDIGVFSEVAEVPTGSRHQRRQRRFKTRVHDWTLRAHREVEGKKDQG